MQIPLFKPFLSIFLQLGLGKRLRSPKWLSSSIPKEDWTKESSKYVSPDYFVNNLVNPTLLLQCFEEIPDNSIIIEIGPHSQLFAQMKRTVGEKCTITALMKRGDTNGINTLLSNLGKCYLAGLDIEPLGLYAPVAFPVSKGTPHISPMIKV